MKIIRAFVKSVIASVSEAISRLTHANVKIAASLMLLAMTLSTFVYADPSPDPDSRRLIQQREEALREALPSEAELRRQDAEVKPTITEADKREALGFIRRRIVEELITVQDGRTDLVPIMSSMGFGAAVEEVVKAVLFQLAHEAAGSSKDLEILEVIADYPEILESIKTAQDLIDAHSRGEMSMSLPQATAVEGIAQLERGSTQARAANIPAVVKGFVETAAFQSWSPETLKIYLGKDLAGLDVAENCVYDANAMMLGNPFFNFDNRGLWFVREILRAYKLAQDRGEANRELFFNFLARIARIGFAMALRDQTVDNILKMFSHDVIQQGMRVFGVQLTSGLSNFSDEELRDPSVQRRVRQRMQQFREGVGTGDPLEVGGFRAKSYLITEVLPFYAIAQQAAVAEKAILDAVKEVVGDKEFEFLYEADQARYQFPKSGFVLYDMSASGDLVVTHILGTETVVIRGFEALLSEASSENPLRVTKENVVVLSRDIQGNSLSVQQIFSRGEHGKKKPDLSDAAAASFEQQIRTRSIRKVYENPPVVTNVVQGGSRVARAVGRAIRGVPGLRRLIGGEAQAQESEEQRRDPQESYVRWFLRTTFKKSLGRRGGHGGGAHENSIRGL